MLDDIRLNFVKERLRIDNGSDYVNYPKFIEIETMSGCNAKCIMCPVPTQKRKGIIKDNLFTQIVDEISHYKDWINFVSLSRNGEPLLDKKLPSRVKQLKDAGIKYVSFSTNASLLTREKGKELLESGLDELRISIDGFSKNTFETVRKGLDYEQVKMNALNFIKMRNDAGIKPSIQIRFVEQEENKHEIKEWTNFWSSVISKNDVVASKKMHSWGNQIYSKNINYENPACISPFSTIEVLYDGIVPLCGCDSVPTIVLGNANKSTIKTIWQSYQFEQIRKKHLNGNRSDIKICGGCNIWDLDIKSVYS